jgi:hypothetical protein
MCFTSRTQLEVMISNLGSPYAEATQLEVMISNLGSPYAEA